MGNCKVFERITDDLEIMDRGIHRESGAYHIEKPLLHVFLSFLIISRHRFCWIPSYCRSVVFQLIIITEKFVNMMIVIIMAIK